MKIINILLRIINVRNRNKKSPFFCFKAINKNSFVSPAQLDWFLKEFLEENLFAKLYFVLK